MAWSFAAFSLAFLVSLSAANATQSCGGEAGWADASFTATLREAETFRHETPSLVFALIPTDHGWQVQMFDGDDAPMAVFAPPIRPVDSNPLTIAGWHFRNLANTGPNTGDVNAPQHLRRFTFGLAAANAADFPETASKVAGMGELRITEFTLTPPKPGERAAMTAITFSACLTWQGGGERLNPIVVADPGVAFETVVSAMIGCGLDTGMYRMSDRMSQGREGGQNPYLEPDLDGDNIPDLVVPVTRISDSAPGLAICLLGDETIIMVGYDGRIGRHLDPAYFGRADFWAIHQGPVFQGATEDPPPVPAGDAVLLAKEESSSVLVYLDHTRTVSSYWQGD